MNKKMSQHIYIYLIFEPVMKSRLEAKKDFLLEEDKDLRHWEKQHCEKLEGWA